MHSQWAAAQQRADRAQLAASALRHCAELASEQLAATHALLAPSHSASGGVEAAGGKVKQTTALHTSGASAALDSSTGSEAEVPHRARLSLRTGVADERSDPSATSVVTATGTATGAVVAAGTTGAASRSLPVSSPEEAAATAARQLLLAALEAATTPPNRPGGTAAQASEAVRATTAASSSAALPAELAALRAQLVSALQQEHGLRDKLFAAQQVHPPCVFHLIH
jgi:hypothetical protein